ncbi:hypothetical protein LIER_22292 [Lithospermum erythrorhizon]|uniref:Uncharacterized protein n=1 Tax=Lithospermum erythrorhizon TaxID=34254 RepID=A0AAV3QVN0_LITER
MNLALLVKQGWIVAIQEASLLFKLLKGRYFHCSTFMNSKLGANPSYWCRSLLEGRKVLEKGIRWRVGNGWSMNICSDQWVPRETDFNVFGVRNMEVSSVSQLIVNGDWDRQRVEGMFGRVYASIPLSRRLIQDKLIWHHTWSGVYLTCSGYKCARAMKRNGDLRGVSSDESSLGGSRGSLLEECVESTSFTPHEVVYLEMSQQYPSNKGSTSTSRDSN